MGITKAEIIESMAKEAGITKVAAEKAYDVLIGGIVRGVKQGPVTLVGFGTFRISERKARTGINPRTGEKIQIAATNALVFKAGKKTKEEVNE